jgi:mRNA-degrading endonuclease RelE of RelBE toxin-antitoxin system
VTIWQIELTKTTQKDIAILSPKLKKKAKELLRTISKDPSIGKPLMGDLKGYFSVYRDGDNKSTYIAYSTLFHYLFPC